jgi:hypothetical protein
MARMIKFYVKYTSLKGTLSHVKILGNRENLSNEKNLFLKVVYTLLHILKEDFQHNNLSIKAIKRLINTMIIDVVYDNQNITQELMNSDFDDNDHNKTFLYFRLLKQDPDMLIEDTLKRFYILGELSTEQISDELIEQTEWF